MRFFSFLGSKGDVHSFSASILQAIFGVIDIATVVQEQATRTVPLLWILQVTLGEEAIDT